MRIIGLPSHQGACAYYRVEEPLRALEKAGFAETYVPPIVGEDRLVKVDRDGNKRPGEPDFVNNYDMIVLQRQPTIGVTNLIEHCKGFGIKTVFDIDDSVLSITPVNPNYLVWGRDRQRIYRAVQIYQAQGIDLPGPLKGKSPEWVSKNAIKTRNNLLKNIRLADMVTTTTPSLLGEYRAYNSNIRLLPNQMNIDHWKDFNDKSPEGRVYILWAGGYTHQMDLKLIRQPITAVLKKFPQAMLVIVGFAQAVELIFDDIPRSQVKIFPWTKDNSYRQFVAQADIILAPSCDNPFNAGKSDIRLLEGWLAAKAPAVGSPTTYGKTLRESGGGLVAATTSKWIRHLSKLISNEGLRKRMGQVGYEYTVAKRTYDVNVGLWKRAYTSLMEGTDG
jgi:glycosyltransferase involved in cell wall biosynthesis